MNYTLKQKIGIALIKNNSYSKTIHYIFAYINNTKYNCNITEDTETN